MQRPTKRKKQNRDGLEYLSYCDFLPFNSLGIISINKIVNDEILLLNEFMAIGGNYLINARIITDKNGGFYFKGTLNNYFLATEELGLLENKLAKILCNLGVWNCGMQVGKPVTAPELIIPILLKKIRLIQ